MVSSPRVAAIDPLVYVRSTQPFQALPEPLFQEVAGALEIAFFPAGTRLVQAGGQPLQHLYVIRKGAVRLERAGRTLQVLEEGEVFGYTSLLTHTATLDVVADGELLTYRLPGAVFQRLLADARFASHFALGLSERLKASLDRSPVAEFRPDLSISVGELVLRAPVWVEAGATVGDAARRMGEERISSVLVRTEPPGIVTDRDLRQKVLGSGHGPELPVERVASRPLRTIAAETPLYDAWVKLLDAGVHHLPVTRDADIVGVLTSGDVLRATAQGPVAVMRGVERLPSREALPGYGARVTAMVSSLVSAGLDATPIAGLVARLNDALLKPILRWAEEELGPPPAPYAWIVFGSEGRMEQTLLTDQDNALVFDDAGAAQAGWYQALAERVGADLERAGFPRCPGGFMARNWCGPLSDWRKRFEGWIEVPTPKALLVASIFFDFRRVGGLLDLEPLEQVIARAAQRPVFLRLLAKDAFEFHPPPDLLLRLRGESSTVDLKRHGISPIVALARRFALEVGTRSRSTLARLDSASRAGMLSAEDASTIAETYRFLLGLRLRLQLRMLAEGRPATNQVRLAELGAIERSRLKDAYRAIRRWQERSAFQLNVDF
jgi:CBS domain-containing protein